MVSLCYHCGVSKSAYYAWSEGKESARDKADRELLDQIRDIFRKSKGRYGSPKVFSILKSRGFAVGEKRVARLMKEHGMVARVETVYRKLNTVREVLRSLPNHRLESESPTGPNQQWSSDVTYIRLGESWVFLAVVLDLWSRQVVGWAFSSQVNSDLSTYALSRALKSRRPPRGLLLHTDRGVEFRNHKMGRWIKRYGIVHSLSRAGRCTDNAEVESFFKTIKGELIKDGVFADAAHLKGQMRHYIHQFYNKERIHSSLNYVSPIQFEANRVR